MLNLVGLRNKKIKWYPEIMYIFAIVISVRPTQPFGPRPPLGGKKIFQKEQPVMDKKPSLSIHIELYIIYPFPNNKYWRTFFSFFHLRKVILPVLVSLGSKGKGFGFEKGKIIWAKGKKVCSYAHDGQQFGLFRLASDWIINF